MEFRGFDSRRAKVVLVHSRMAGNSRLTAGMVGF